MRKLLLLPALLSAALLATTAQAQNYQGPNAQGGFAGPNQQTTMMTVEQAKLLRDDARVVLRGYIVERISDDNYTFRDSTGSIRVDIDHDKWAGQTVKPEDLVEIRGEIDKDWNSIEIDVKSISLIK